ncbi:MAG: NAD(P)H-dependent oxidoreductase subunit E [Spirochaetales bacterium]|nr:NAD(P)H-dependent oxidoreductase subunit E [Spirochaetales bacterium]
MENKKITICMGSSCFSRGNKDNLKIIQDYLKGVDGAELLLTGALCQEKCSQGPVIFLGETLHKEVNPDHLPDLLQAYVYEDLGREDTGSL